MSTSRTLPKASIAACRINRLARLRNSRTYLEIGVACGNTFFNVDLPHKTGVDPRFAFNAPAMVGSNEFLIEATSDAFFQRLPQIQQQLYGAPTLYDIIYIDGLHTFEQTIKDFVHTLPYSHQGTIWIFDDTVPSDPYSALADSVRSLLFRHVAGLAGASWHGDVYKCVFALHDYFAEFSWCTPTDAGNPQTVVWRTPQPTTRPRLLPDMASIKALGYFDLLTMAHMLNPVPDETLLEQLGTPFHYQPERSGSCVAQIVRPLRLRAGL